ncbi:helix-turn-helix domain-containing protein [Micromonospora sp. NPDC093277]|uniref:helix-turn-helix domain-containing protein n=1 Tax=Micromonospora sp. NPDC093277 TaxID=3364291 RepID=UPI003822E92C
MVRTVKRAFKYHFYPTDVQAAELARTFGCVRKVYNLALAARTEAWTLRQERVTYHATSAMLTGWKKTEDLAFLAEVSSVPLTLSGFALRSLPETKSAVGGDGGASGDVVSHSAQRSDHRR